MDLSRGMYVRAEHDHAPLASNIPHQGNTKLSLRVKRAIDIFLRGTRNGRGPKGVRGKQRRSCESGKGEEEEGRRSAFHPTTFAAESQTSPEKYCTSASLTAIEWTASKRSGQKRGTHEDRRRLSVQGSVRIAGGRCGGGFGRFGCLLPRVGKGALIVASAAEEIAKILAALLSGYRSGRKRGGWEARGRSISD